MQPQDQPTPPMSAPQPTAPAPVTPQSGVSQPAPQPSNPGQVMGIMSIVLSVFLLWIVGLPLGIVSIVKSRNAKMSPLLGIIGTILNVLALLGSIFFLMIILMTYSSFQAKVKASTTADQAATSASKSAIKADVPLTSSYKVEKAGGAVYWATGSVTMAGWTMDKVDQEGQNHWVKDDKTAEFTTLQADEPSLNQPLDLDATRAGVKLATSGSPSLALGKESRIAIPQLSDGKTVEMLVTDYTFTTASSVPVKARILGRSFDGGMSLYAWYTTTNASINEDEWTAFVDGLQVNDGAL